MATRRQIEQEIVQLLRAVRVTEGQERTVLVRRLAEQMADLRMHFLTPAGDPDWTGRTGAYRYAVRELYLRAGYSAQERKLVQTATRHHLGAIVRKRIPPETAAGLGLAPTTPKERSTLRSRKDREELRELLTEARKLLAQKKQGRKPAQ